MNIMKECKVKLSAQCRVNAGKVEKHTSWRVLKN